MSSDIDDIVLRYKFTLNIGGMDFFTSYRTLRKSKLFAELIDTPGAHEKYRTIFIDRDHTHFRHILNYLRDPEMVPQLKPSKCKELLAEAYFYEITGLVEELESQIANEVKPQDASEVKPKNADSSTDGSNKSWFGSGGRSKYATKRRHRHYK